MVFTYGVGALVDLPHLSALVMGLDDWTVDGGVAHPIDEERLLRTVRWQLGSQVQKLLSPPAVPQSMGQIDPFGELARIGVPVALFPRWLFCPKCQRLAPLSTGMFTRTDDAYHPERTRFVHNNCLKEKNPVVVPARFLVACENGHLDDFPWVEFTHRGPTTCTTLLQLIEYGPSGEARDLEVRCDVDGCGARRRLSEAFGEEGRTRMPPCRGRRPHLRDFAEQPCDQQVKTILLSASNPWFADSVTALAIPTESSKLAQLVENKWATLQQIPNEQFITLMRQMTPNPFGDFVGYSDAAIWQAIEKRRAQQQSSVHDDPSDLKQPEWEKLSHPENHTPAKDFRLRAVPAPNGFEALLACVVLVERLREVRALLGFTRIDAPGELGAGPDAGQSRRMPLSRQLPAWVPAAEVRGEGIFIQFNEARLAAWLATDAAKQREQQFLESHVRWRQARKLPLYGNFPGLRYVLLHSFAHALMRHSWSRSATPRSALPTRSAPSTSRASAGRRSTRLPATPVCSRRRHPASGATSTSTARCWSRRSSGRIWRSFRR